MRLTARSTLKTVTGVVAGALARHGINAVLTGGACASLHCAGRYFSQDIDFILMEALTRKQLDAAMGSVGFARKGNQYFHPRTRFYVEFPRGPLAIGADFGIRPFRIRIDQVHVKALSPTDSCRDRLAAFYHWTDRQSLQAAVLIALHSRVNLPKIKKWSAAEGFANRCQEFLSELRRARQKKA